MRYWLYLAGKFAICLGVVYALQVAVEELFPDPPTPLPQFGKPLPMFLHDMTFTFAIFAVWLVGAGLLSLAVWDQKRRCRVCLRRLIMPLHSGSWGHLVTVGRPKTEWICSFGHGALSIDDLQITGLQPPDWQPHDDNIWKELESYQARK